MAGTIITPSILSRDLLRAQIPSYVQTTHLDHGIEVRDFRLFPTTDAQRFIVEIHNTTDEAMDTPAVGVVLPHLVKGEDYGFAGPALSVLSPHSSGVLIGVAPEGVDTDDDWETPEWILCEVPDDSQARAISDLDIELSYVLEYVTDESADVVVLSTNHGDALERHFAISGVVRDGQHRVCGILPSQRGYLDPGTQRYHRWHMNAENRYIGNPFTLLDSPAEMIVEPSLQPLHWGSVFSCSAVMPWNR